MADLRIAAFELGYYTWMVKYSYSYLWFYRDYYDRSITHDDPATGLTSQFEGLQQAVTQLKPCIKPRTRTSLNKRLATLNTAITAMIKAYRRGDEAFRRSPFGHGVCPCEVAYSPVLDQVESLLRHRPTLESWALLGSRLGNAHVDMLDGSDSRLMEAIFAVLEAASQLKTSLPIVDACRMASEQRPSPVRLRDAQQALFSAAGLPDPATQTAMAEDILDGIEACRQALTLVAEEQSQGQPPPDNPPADESVEADPLDNLLSAAELADMEPPEIVSTVCRIVNLPEPDAVDVPQFLKQVAERAYQLEVLLKAAADCQQGRQDVTPLEQWRLGLEESRTSRPRTAAERPVDPPTRVSLHQGLRAFHGELVRQFQEHLSPLDLQLQIKGKHTQAILNDESYEITHDQYLVVKAIQEAGGEFITAKTMGERYWPDLKIKPRIDRLVRDLPEPLKAMIESSAERSTEGDKAGYRLRLD